MWRDTRYIRRNHIRLDAKAVCVGTGCRVMDRVHEFKDVRGAVAIADTGEGDSAAHIFELMNPIHHAASRSDADRFRVEPYVIAADVASVAPHTGRGGWTWYT